MRQIIAILGFAFSFTVIAAIDCDWYTTDIGAQWLPTAYAEAARCACTLQGLPGAQSPTAKCVRAVVQESHKGEGYFSAAAKQSILDVKNQYANAWFYGPEYYRTLYSTAFADIAHRLHEDAYLTCGCPGKPATWWAWLGVSVFGASECAREIKAIERFGPCGRDGW